MAYVLESNGSETGCELLCVVSVVWSRASKAVEEIRNGISSRVCNWMGVDVRGTS